MLVAIREFIKRYRVVSTEQLTREFRLAQDALMPMLTIWVNKGLIRKLSAETNCGACRSCLPKRTTSEYYEWC